MKWSILPCIMMEESSMSSEWSKQLWKARTHALVLSLSWRNLWLYLATFAQDHFSSVIRRLKFARDSKRSEVISCVVREWKRRWGEWVHRDLGLPWSPGLWFGVWEGRQGERSALATLRSRQFLAHSLNTSRGPVLPSGTALETFVCSLCLISPSPFSRWSSTALQDETLAKLDLFCSVNKESYSKVWHFKTWAPFVPYTRNPRAPYITRGEGKQCARWGFTALSLWCHYGTGNRCNV